MLPEYFVVFGAILSFFGALSYVIDTIKGKTKPNKVTWFLWTLAPLIAFYAQIQQGVGLAALLTFMVGFNPLLIFLASFVNRKSQWKIGKLDIVCLILSIVGLVLWQVTQIGNIAIFFALFADAIAGLPTMIKSWKFPETENYKGYLTSGISASITLLTINVWRFEYYAFSLYIFIASFILFVLVKFKLGKRLR